MVNRELGIRRSYLAETRRVAGEFLRRNLQVIVFAQSRLSTEILTTYLKEDFEDVPGMPERIRGYRGGYLPLRRREIEKGLREGQVRGVVSTNALELGIDIGALDVCVMAGYPGTIASTWQRAGRAGRRTGRSAAVMVASSAPIDQFVVRHPSYFFDASPEHALVNPDNLHILVDHVKCAAFELPFTTEERFGQVERPGGAGRAAGVRPGPPVRRPRMRTGQWHWTSESYPANAVSLRSVSSDNSCRRSDRRREGDRRDRFHQRAVDAPPQGDLHGRRAGCSRSRSSISTAARRTSAKSTATTTRRRSRTRRSRILDRFAVDAPTSRITAKCTSCRASSASRRSVLHQRERRLGRARPARAADAHDRVLARGSAGGR